MVKILIQRWALAPWICAFFIFALRWERQMWLASEFEMRLLSDYENPTSSPSSLPACTEEEYIWPQPSNIKSNKYQNVIQAQAILRFLITKLDAINAPVTLMYGTALHEYRNGTTDCVQPKYWDKDFDVALFPEHYVYITTFKAEIMQRFGWEFVEHTRERLFSMIRPAHGPKGKGDLFQIDVYGFFCNPQEDRIYFPWDKIMVAKNAILPLKKHKLILPMNDTATHNGTSNPGFFMPHNPPCLLENLYGSDYMTPKTGKSTQAKYGSQSGGRPSFDNPSCNSTLTADEELELKRQLGFCSGAVPTIRSS